MPRTVVVISHLINEDWTLAKPDTVIDRYGGEAAHATILTEKLADGTYRDRNSAGPDWADRGTVRVTSRFLSALIDKWRITYKGPLFHG